MICPAKDGLPPLVFPLTRYKCDGLPRSIMARPWQSTLPRLRFASYALERYMGPLGLHIILHACPVPKVLAGTINQSKRFS
jgi:hypothetical protein